MRVPALENKATTSKLDRNFLVVIQKLKTWMLFKTLSKKKMARDFPILSQFEHKIYINTAIWAIRSQQGGAGECNKAPYLPFLTPTRSECRWKR